MTAAGTELEDKVKTFGEGVLDLTKHRRDPDGLCLLILNDEKIDEQHEKQLHFRDSLFSSSCFPLKSMTKMHHKCNTAGQTKLF